MRLMFGPSSTRLTVGTKSTLYNRVADILKRNEYDGPVSVVFEGQRYSNCTDREALAMAVEHLRETMGVPAPTS